MIHNIKVITMNMKHLAHLFRLMLSAVEYGYCMSRFQRPINDFPADEPGAAKH